jgi:hypothetical protein
MFSLGLAMIYGDDFTLGIAALVVVAVWSIGAWLVSKELAKKKPRKLTNKLAYRGYLFWKWGVVSLILAGLTLSVLFVNQKRVDKELQALHGTLFAGSEPTPVNPCSQFVGKDQFVLDFTSDLVAPKSFPFPVLAVKHEPVLVLDRSTSGVISLSLTIRGPDGRLIVELTKNEFTVNPNNIFSMKRDSRSRLVVRDQYGGVVLDADYLNPQFLRLSAGKFYSSGVLVNIQRFLLQGRPCLQTDGKGRTFPMFDLQYNHP